MSKHIRAQATNWARERHAAGKGPLPSLKAMREYAAIDHVWSIGNQFFQNAGGHGEVFVVFQHRLAHAGTTHYTLHVGRDSMDTDDASVPMTHTSAMSLLSTFDYVHTYTCEDGTTIHVGCDDRPDTAKHMVMQYRFLIEDIEFFCI